MKKQPFSLCSLIIIICLLSLTKINCSAGEKPSSLKAASAILMDGSNQRILFGKDETKELPMASTTKIMTCLYALEHGALTDIVTFSDNASSAPKVHLGAPAGSQFLLSDLLYALMLESYNDVAVAIAEHISGSVETFCQDMTQEVKDYGCYHTSFKTPNGLDDENHYTTCYDLALITCHALQNDKFRSIIKESSYSIKDLEHKQSYQLHNKDAFLMSYPDAIGVKTGYTSKAGYCFVGAVEKKDRLLITVVLGSGWPPHRSWKWEDTKKLMDYGIKNYSMKTVILNDDLPDLLPVDCGQTNECEINTVKSVDLLIASNEDIIINTDIPSVLTAPVNKGDIIGTISLYVNDILYRSYPIQVQQSVKKIDFRYCFQRLLKYL